jgi:dihydroneopterin aldolase
MSDRIVLSGMRFEGRHGVGEDERSYPQPIEVDLEVHLDLEPAGRSDDLAQTVDYGPLIERCREVVEDRSFRLLEAIAETIAAATLADARVDAVVVRVRKLAVPVDADLDHAQIEISRSRPAGPG